MAVSVLPPEKTQARYKNNPTGHRATNKTQFFSPNIEHFAIARINNIVAFDERSDL
jgi:hypothetical protein